MAVTVGFLSFVLSRLLLRSIVLSLRLHVLVRLPLSLPCSLSLSSMVSLDGLGFVNSFVKQKLRNFQRKKLALNLVVLLVVVVVVVIYALLTSTQNQGGFCCCFVYFCFVSMFVCVCVLGWEFVFGGILLFTCVVVIFFELFLFCWER